MKSKVLSLLVLLLTTVYVQAQVSGYAFSQPAGVYTPITGGTILGNIASDDERFVDPAAPLGGTINTGVGFPIGFNFTFNGTGYDRFAINNNGWISLGQSSQTPSVNIQSTSLYTAISSTSTAPAALQNHIAGLARDIQSQAGGELRIELIGTTPNQVQVIQWSNYKKFTSGVGDLFSFQIRMYETTNVVEVVYGSWTNNATSSTAQVGLRGNLNTDFNNRTTTTNWTTTTAGGLNTSSCTHSATVFPPSGLTFRWTPPVVTIDMLATTLTSPAALSCLGSNETVTVQIRNSGNSTINFAVDNVTLSSSVTGPNPMTFTPVVLSTGTLAPTATQNVVVAIGYNMSAAGVYTFSANTSVVGDINTANDAMVAQVRTAATVSLNMSSNVTLCSGGTTNLTATPSPSFLPMSFQFVGAIAVPDATPAGIDAPIVVSGVPANFIPTTLILDTITHTFDADLDINLVAPGGSSIDVCSDNGGAADNFFNTVLTGTALTSITTGTAPFTGMFLPETPLFNAAGGPNGTWNLHVVDDLGGDLGLIRRITLAFSDPYTIVTYAWSPVAGLSSTTIANPVANPTITTTYTVTATAINGCTFTNTVTVTVNPLPVVALGTDITQCGGTAMLDAGNPGASYVWSTSATTQQITASSTATYSVVVTDANGCTGTDAIDVTINPLPTVTLGANQTQCGGTVMLDAGNPGASYLWSTTETTQTITVSTSATYSVVVTDANGCTGTGTVDITINALPVVTLGPNITQCAGTALLDAGNPGASYLWSTSATTQTITVSTSATYSVVVTDGNGCTGTGTVDVTINALPVVALGPDVTQCGGSVQLDAGNPGSTYLWNTSATFQQITVGVTGTYSVVVTDVNGCTNSDAIDVTINTPPTVFLGNDVTICADSLILDAGNPGASFLWSTSATTQMLTVYTTNTYSVVVTDVNGCTNSDVINVTISPLPLIDLGADTTICLGNSITLIAPPAFSSYLWTDGNISSNQQFITVAPAQTTTYWVTVSNSSGCFATDTIIVNVITIPTPSFTSNITSLNNVAFTNTSVIPPYTSVWDFGDASPFSSVTSPSHIYANNGSYNVVLTVTNQCGSTSTFQTIVISGLGLGEETTLAGINLFPNPSTGLLTLTLSDASIDAIEIRILDVTGKALKVFADNTQGASYSRQLDLTDLSNGLYFVEVRAGERSDLIRVSLNK